MKASETTLQSVIEGSKQYIVPLYQRSYRWEKKHWQTLWDDLVELCESAGPRTHFLGSLVTMQTTSVPEGVPKYFLIDGQQRLTTIFILLTLLRDNSRANGDVELGAEIENLLLVNAYKKGNEYFKILPTQDDRQAFEALIRGQESESKSGIALAYRYFEAKLRGKGPGVPALKKAITENLSVVSIVLDRDDNPYLVFESLNAKGEPLTQADLIRNFFFLKIHSDLQDEMHARYWQPMQDALGDRLTEFVRHYLMKQGSLVRSDAVYFTLKDRLGSGDAVPLLGDLSHSATLYRRFVDPEREPHTGLSEALRRLNRLDVTTAYPFLLNAYDELEAGKLSPDELAQIVSCLENFIIRRFVCNYPTNQLNKLFPPLFNQIKASGHTHLLDGVCKLLPSKGYPKDFEFRTRLADSKLYGGGDRRARTRFILEGIEKSYGHKERVNLADLNIEHVMPQTLSEAWREELGDQWEVAHQLLLDTLGNLTLTGYNPELSNSAFTAKKLLFAQSNVEMNQYFESPAHWSKEDIERRGESLAEVAVGIWPYFGDEPREAAADEAVKGEPATVRFLDRSYPVKNWRDVLEATLNALGESDREILEGLVVDLPALLSHDVNKFRSSRQLACGLHFNTHGSIKTIKRWCERILDSAGITSEDWTVELAQRSQADA